MNKGQILEKLWLRLPGTPKNIDIDSEQNAVRFDYQGIRFRVDTHLSVESVEGGLLKSCVASSLMQALLSL